jgi:hypothetical protein
VSDHIAEYDVVILTRDIPDKGLIAGDVGVVLLTHAGHDDIPPGYTVEVTTLLGETVAVVDVPANLVRPVTDRDVRHTRPAPLRA